MEGVRNEVILTDKEKKKISKLCQHKDCLKNKGRNKKYCKNHNCAIWGCKEIVNQNEYNYRLKHLCEEHANRSCSYVIVTGKIDLLDTVFYQEKYCDKISSHKDNKYCNKHICMKPFCRNQKMKERTKFGGNLCKTHYDELFKVTCRYNQCKNRREKGDYCFYHTCSNESCKKKIENKEGLCEYHFSLIHGKLCSKYSCKNRVKGYNSIDMNKCCPKHACSHSSDACVKQHKQFLKSVCVISIVRNSRKKLIV